jgi:polyhydroxyalkanoate synthase subunit PhaC
MSEDDKRDPVREMTSFWADAAQGYSNAFQAFWDAATDASGRPDAATGAAGSFEQMADQWQRGLTALTSLQLRFVEGLLADAPDAMEARLDATTFGQLQRMTAARWEEELQRAAEAPAELSARASQVDTERVGRLWEGMWAEVLRDLQSLPGDAFQVDLRPLARAWGQVLSGDPDPDARRMVERFVESAAVKARLGSEYYADPDATVVGQTPRECVFQQGRIKLYRYLAPDGTPAADTEPVLLVYSVINKPYILDLVPGYSFVEHLLSQGLDVYLIDWGEIEAGDRETTLDSYIDPGIRGCVDAIRERTGADQVSLFGHCIGGNLALMYAALHPDDVARMVILTTPITAAEGGVVALWTDRDVFPVDAIVEAYGHMPAKLIRYTFMAIKPYYEVMKFKLFLENLNNDAVMDLFYPVDRWANENVDIPGEVFRKFITEVFHDEQFARGKTRINGRKVDLKAITCPLLNLAATRDWIVPQPSAEVLGELVSSEDNRFVPIEGAHVGIMIDPRSRTHWTTMSDFLGGEAG